MVDSNGNTALMAAARSSMMESRMERSPSRMGLHSIDGELLQSILTSRDSLRCRDLGRLARVCRLFTAVHVDAAAEGIVAHRLPAAQARSPRRPGQRWLRTLGELEALENRMRGWTGSCVVGQDVWEHRMCTFDVWVKEAETIPALMEMLEIDAYPGEWAHLHGMRPHLEEIIGYTILESEWTHKRFKFTIAALAATGDNTSGFVFLVKFINASMSQKERALLAPWIDTLDRQFNRCDSKVRELVHNPSHYMQRCGPGHPTTAAG